MEGGGGGQMFMCARKLRARSPKSLTAGVRNLYFAAGVKGPGSFRVLDALSCYSSLICRYSDTKWDTNNHSRSKWGGGGGACCAPLWTATALYLFISRPSWNRRSRLRFLFTLKAPGSNLTRKGSIGAKLHSGSRMTRKSGGQLSADLTNNGVRLTQFWVMFRVRLTDFRVIVDPEWSLAPMDPFQVKFDPGVFRVLF